MAQSDVLLKIEGIDGETQQEGKSGWMELSSWSIGGHNSSTFGSGTGGGKGKSSVSDLVCSKVKDKASTNIFMYCLTGKHVDKVTLEARKAAGDKKLTYLTVTLKNCFITSYQQSGGEDGGAMESLSVTFEEIEEKYQPQDKAGNPEGGEISFMYNVATGASGGGA
jgi:type VI secretion system secreted protein Hcp